MKKSNWLVFILLTTASVFLLCLWYALGFNQVDDPLDLLISIIWWVLIVVMWYFVFKAEQRRRVEVRTVYVAPNELYNSERGIVALNGLDDAPAQLAEVLSDLEYGFGVKDYPSDDAFKPLFIVRTTEFVPAGASQDGSGSAASEPRTWKGVVIKIDGANNNPQTSFDGMAQLKSVLVK